MKLLKIIFLLALILTPSNGVKIASQGTTVEPLDDNLDSEIKEIQSQITDVDATSLLKEYNEGKEGEEENISEEDIREFSFKATATASKNDYVDNSEVINMFTTPNTAEESKRVYGYTAGATSTFRWGFWWWRRYTYSPYKALKQYSGYWRSRNWRKFDAWIGYLTTGKTLEKVSYMQIEWRYPPTSFKITFKEGPGRPFIACTERITIYKYLVDGKVQSKKTVPKKMTIVFNKPIRAMQIAIEMYDPLNGSYFGINSVDFFSQSEHVIFKNQLVDKCFNYCFFVNTDIPKEGTIVEGYPCLKAIELGRNNEIFIERTDGKMQYSNTDLCLGFNGSDELALFKCISTKFVLLTRQDSSLFFKGFDTKCLSIDMSDTNGVNYVDTNTEIISSSNFDNSFSVNYLGKGGDSFWNSIPGENKVSIQFMIGKIDSYQFENKAIDTIRFEWVREPKDFSVYSWRPNEGWNLLQTIKDNKLKLTEIKVQGLQCAAIMLVLQESQQQKDLSNLPAFGIRSAFIGVNSFRIKYLECKSVNANSKTFEMEKQSNFDISKTNDALADISKINEEYKKALEAYKKLLSNTKYINSMKEHASKFAEELNKKNDFINEAFKNLLDFNSESLDYYEGSFDEIRKKYDPDKKTDDLSEEVPGVLGSELNPAENCLQIKTIINKAESGFYYIKPECAPETIKVYCQFNSAGLVAADYYIIGQPGQDLSYLDLKDYNSIREQCGKVGLEAIDIQKSEQIRIINNILAVNGFNLAKQAVIPLAYDYRCIDGMNCNNDFRSLAYNSGKKITQLFKTNPRDQSRGKNMIGLGYSDSLIATRFNFDTKTKVAALVCSTNKYKKSGSTTSTLSISCGFTIKQNQRLFGNSGKVLVMCPQNCPDSAGKVVGKGKYDLTSSICLSAINAGVITKEGGGKLYVQKTRGNSSSKVQQGSFMVLKYDKKCPNLDQNKFSSFTEIKMLSSGIFDTVKEVAESGADTSKLTDKAKDAVDSAKDMGSDLMKQSQQALNNLVENTANPALDAVKENAKITEQATNNLMNSVSNQVNQELNKNTESENKDENAENAGIGAEDKEEEAPCPDCDSAGADLSDEDDKVCPANTFEAINEAQKNIEETYNQKINEIKLKFDLIISKIEQFKKDYSWKDSDDLSVSSLKEKISQFDKLKTDFDKQIKRMETGSILRIQSSQTLLNNLQKKYNDLLEGKTQEGLLTKPDFSVNKYYDVFSFTAAKSTIWEIKEINNDYISRGLGNTFDNYKVNPSSFFDSLITLKYGMWYNFELNTNLMIKEQGSNAGVAFRVNSPFKFYCVDFNKQLGQLSLVKYVYGTATTLDVLKNVDISLNSWYKIYITCVGKYIKALIKRQSNDESENEYVLTTLDSTFSSGKAGVYSNKKAAILFDEILIMPKPINNAWKPSGRNTKVLNNRASTFIETFDSSIYTRSFILVPKTQKEGPTKWQVISKIKGPDRYLGLAQKSLIRGEYPQDRTAFIYKENINIKNGIYTVGFVPDLYKGIISFFFKFDANNFNYYCLDFESTSSDNGTLVLRRINNRRKEAILAKNETVAYKTKSMQELKIKVIGDTIEVGYSLKRQPFETVLSYTDDKMLLAGSIGVGTSASFVTFTKIELKPLKRNDKLFEEPEENKAEGENGEQTESISSVNDFLGVSSSGTSSSSNSILEDLEEMNSEAGADGSSESGGAQKEWNSDYPVLPTADNGKSDNEELINNEDEDTDLEPSNEESPKEEGENNEENQTELERMENLFNQKEQSEAKDQKEEKYHSRYEQCIGPQNTKERKDVCSRINSQDTEAIDNCVNNFCTVCCDEYGSENERDFSHLCKKECALIQIQDEISEDQTIGLCLEDAEDRQYKKCEEDRSYEEAQECKIDLCIYCCGNLKQFGVGINDKAYDECKASCTNYFNNKMS